MMIQNVSRANEALLKDPSKKVEQSSLEKSIEKRAKTVQEESQKKQEKQEKQAKVDKPENFVMSELDIRELFLIMGSRGGNKTIETLAKMVKEQRKHQR